MAKKPIKTWKEKLNTANGLPKVVKLEGAMKVKWKADTLAVPCPLDIDEIMKKIPKGKLTTTGEIARKIAEKYNADKGCPFTTGIFAWIASHAADEELREGKKRITPYWRTLKAEGILNEKYPGGIKAQKKRLEEEGFTIIKKGSKYKVQNLDKYLKY